MHLRPESDLLNWELLRFIERCCKQGGSVTEGGPDHHQFFVEMSDQEMQAVVRAIISGFRLATSRAVTINGLEGRHPERFLGQIRTLLYLVARGNILFNYDEVPMFFMPTGSPPSPEMRDTILARIRHDHPMHIAIANDIIEETTSESSTESEPVQ